MVKMLSACTYEIDDVSLAVSEILNQLDLENNQRKNSVGLISCYNEFLDTGVVDALVKVLPFDIVGCSTLGNGVNGGYGVMMLCISVLTSDDLIFSTAKTGPLGANLEDELKRAYNEAESRLPGKPSLIIEYAPLIGDISGELIDDTLDKVSGGVQVFGTIACDHREGIKGAHTIYNGFSSKEALSMLLIYGDIKPRYFIASISEEKIQKQKAIITKSQGNLLIEVNGIPILDYLKTLGLTEGDGIEGMGAVPFVFDYKDGTAPVCRTAYMLTPDGHISCGGRIPVNATLAIGSLDYHEVIQTVKDLVSDINKEEDINGVIIFPCLSRNLVLGTDVLAELKQINEGFREDVPYQVCYSGGEFCPVFNVQGGTLNRFHNFTLIACAI